MEPINIIQLVFSANFWLALLITMAVIPVLRRPAIAIGLLDHPGGRKQHAKPVPLIGGPAIFLAVMATCQLNGVFDGFDGLAVAAIGLFLVGLIDDRFDLAAPLRLLIQTSLVLYALWEDNIWITQIALHPKLAIELGWLQYPLTMLAILGVMNAINMLDGLDGLSSGVVLIILGFIIGIAASAGESSIALIGITIFGAVLGFWAFNYRFSWRVRASVFMGDSGTVLLGFMLPYLAIKLSNSAQAVAPQHLLLWLFALPIWDIVAVVVKRIRDGRSPLEAGRDHVHHVLLNTGLTVRHTLHLIYLLTIASVAFGISLHHFAVGVIESYSAFLVFMAFYLGRVGSLSRREKQKIYDFRVEGDRRKEPTLGDSDVVVDIEKRRNTLS